MHAVVQFTLSVVYFFVQNFEVENQNQIVFLMADEDEFKFEIRYSDVREIKRKEERERFVFVILGIQLLQ